MPEPAANLDGIRALLAHLPGPDLEAGTAAALRERQLTKPAGALGRLEELAAWLATWQGRHPPRLDHPRTVVFAANHGVAARGVSAYPAAVTAQMVQNFIAGGAAVNQLCRAVDADLRVYEMNLDAPTADIVDAPAMSEEECGRAIAYGMGAVLAARMGRVPVVLDGFSAGAAAAVLYAADPRALDHCVAGHVSAEPGHRLLLEKIGKPALLDLGMRLGEASGATLALSLLKAAVACHAGMATFAEAGVSGRSG